MLSWQGDAYPATSTTSPTNALSMRPRNRPAAMRQPLAAVVGRRGGPKPATATTGMAVN